MSRVQRLVSDTQERGVQSQKMCQKFIDRGYPKNIVQEAQLWVNYPKTSKKQSECIPFVTQYSDYSDSIVQVLRRHWYILKNAYPTVNEFKLPPLISYRQGKTIERITFLGMRTKGMFPCLNCVQCPYVHRGREFVRPNSDLKIHLRGYYTCVSKFAVYVLICPCGLIYVVETTQMIKLRISQQRSAINLGNMTLPVAKNFVEKGHTSSDQLRFMVLETIPPQKRGGDQELKLKKREVCWINKLNSLYPAGLNRDYDFFLFI
ncbi:hypothetical protein XELAEV_18029706mg [Xenopus laevis]|uniref:Uncharacterized protein n=1 Tax=Xenopus laevis TaxID=8355 RepID=A0A974HI12_XENLA|nr:hypothetical protein XELAEV_18029706mg [Xenopus laevis]